MKRLLLVIVFLASAVAVHAQAVATTPAVTLSQERAVHKYPDLGVQGSALNQAFVDVFNQWKVWKPKILQRDDWPEIVAREAFTVWEARRHEEARRAKLLLEEKPATEMRTPHAYSKP